MAGQHPPSTAIVMERVPLLLLSKLAVTHLVDILKCLSLPFLVVGMISFPEIVSVTLF